MTEDQKLDLLREIRKKYGARDWQWWLVSLPIWKVLGVMVEEDIERAVKERR